MVVWCPSTLITRNLGGASFSTKSSPPLNLSIISSVNVDEVHSTTKQMSGAHMYALGKELASDYGEEMKEEQLTHTFLLG